MLQAQADRESLSILARTMEYYLFIRMHPKLEAREMKLRLARVCYYSGDTPLKSQDHFA